jgi:hypothetical protein
MDAKNRNGKYKLLFMDEKNRNRKYKLLFMDTKEKNGKYKLLFMDTKKRKLIFMDVNILDIFIIFSSYRRFCGS